MKIELTPTLRQSSGMEAAGQGSTVIGASCVRAAAIAIRALAIVAATWFFWGLLFLIPIVGGVILQYLGDIITRPAAWAAGP